MTKEKKDALQAVENKMATQESATEARAVLTHSKMQLAFFTSSMLPAAEVREYENVLPGAADRLLSMMEKEQADRTEIELKKIGAMIERSGADTRVTLRAQIIAGALVFSAIVGAVACAALDQSAAACALAALTGSLAFFFKYKRKERDEEKEE